MSDPTDDLDPVLAERLKACACPPMGRGRAGNTGMYIVLLVWVLAWTGAGLWLATWATNVRNAVGGLLESDWLTHLAFGALGAMVGLLTAAPFLLAAQLLRVREAARRAAAVRQELMWQSIDLESQKAPRPAGGD